MKSLAIIPARGGSKRIPRKNIRIFNGKPIISYSITAAVDSGLFDEVMVSTDDAEIASTAKNLGAKVPFLRSLENSSDTAGTAEVILEVLKEYEKSGEKFEQVCCIYPTAVFIDPKILKEAHSKLSQYDSVFPVTQYSYPIQRSLRIHANGNAEMLWPENYSKRSQDFEPVFHDAGQFYFLRIEKFRIERKLFLKNSSAIVRSGLDVQDIDNESDWALAEIKHKLRMKHV